MATHRPSLPVLIPALADALVLNGSFFLAIWLRFQANLAFVSYPMPPLSMYLKTLLVLNYVCAFLFLAMGVYKRERFQTITDELNLILKAFTGTMAFMLSLSFFFRDVDFSRLVTGYAWGFGILGFTGVRYAVSLYEKRLRERGTLGTSVLVVGVEGMAEQLTRKFREKPGLGYQVAGFVRTDNESLPPWLREEQVLGRVEDLPALLDTIRPGAVFVAAPSLPHHVLLEVVEVCEQRGILVSMVPSIFDLLISYRDVTNIDGLPLVSLEENTWSELSNALKRSFDILFSLAVLLLSAPLWVVIVAAIRLTSPGPVFFRQQRCGEGGRPFLMLKFRTMVPDAEQRLPELLNVEQLSEPVFKLDNDPRVTRVGRVLRRTSLDELPQFVNVLLGQMSVVGPRPEEKRMVERYNVWQRRRLKVKPGITGLQQTTNRGNSSLSERIKYDIYYIRRRSFLLDLNIIVRTVWVVLRGDGAR